MENTTAVPPVALITGCSTGIGFETSLLLAREGYRVFATMRDLAKAVPLREAAKGLPLEILALDVDRTDSVKRALSAVKKRAGRVDVLVNNAGWGAFGAMEEFTDGEILAQYETNVFGLLRVTKAVLPLMRAQRSGRIVHVGSLAGKMTFAGIGLYCSSKFAVEAVSDSLRLEVRPFGIDVTVVEPGSTRTPFKDNRRRSAAFLKGGSPYQKALSEVLASGDHKSFLAATPRKIAGTILKALKEDRMAGRYRAGLDAVWFPVIRWFMPDFLWDSFQHRLYRRFQKGAA
jgi:NAD(P)-dependent dehydrogenase (short-subunit alcohol dehydrogenase family)